MSIKHAREALRRWALGALLLAFLVSVGVAPAQAGEGCVRANELHAGYEELLARYVREDGVLYRAWHESADDARALDRYISGLAELDPAPWPHDDALAYWINLYNAATLQLIVQNYPLESIKELGGFLKSSPWKRELLQIAGRDLSLNDIENEIIRPTFEDARIHFALNCASVGCPPLSTQPYRAATLDGQLDAATRRALNDERWVRVEGDEVRVSKIFDWYKDDFVRAAGSVRAYLARYYQNESAPLPTSEYHVEHMDYDWSLNEASPARERES